jgi:DNA-binding NtrC family response regulator
MESELFGHEKGSFTGATRSHEGIFERASGGTLFLDEVTEMPVELQVKLLRVLETGRLRRVGGDREIEVDVRLIAATNRDLNDAVAEHKLRQDLLYRLMVFPIELPPLRARGRDIDLLAQSILDELNAEQGSDKELTAAARQRLRDHDWPGNVRELQNVVQRAFIMAGEQIELPDLPLSGRREPRRPDAGEEATGGIWIEVGQSVREAERRLILATLERTDGDKKEAAELLGISLKTLYNRLHAYAAESEESGESEASGESSSEPERPAPDSPEAPPDTAASPSAG